MSTDIGHIRNIGIVAHIDAGKTTVTERILFYTGKEHRMGEVHEGTATMDYLEEEQKRGITIQSAATTLTWNRHSINLIDTPGHVDFTAEVERSLRVLDGAVGVFCGVAGVEAQSETVWRQADSYSIPRLVFINKLDRVGADFKRVLTSIRTKLKCNAVPVFIPIGIEKELRGAIDVVREKALFYGEESLGAAVTEDEIPADMTEVAHAARQELLEKLAEGGADEIMDLYVEEKPVPVTLIQDAIRKQTLGGTFVPVLCGSALRNKGVQQVLNAVCEYLPSPLDLPPIEAVVAETSRKKSRRKTTVDPQIKTTQLTPDEKGPLAAMVFKTTSDHHGEVSYVRVYSGTLQDGGQVYNAGQEKIERVGRMYRMHASDREKVTRLGPGEIGTLIGLKFARTGDSLSSKSNPLLLEAPLFPETVVSMAVEPKTAADKDRVIEVLGIVSKDDPTFSCHVDEDTGQMIIAGMGELHLEVIQQKMSRDYKVQVNVGKPRVSYRQSIEKHARGEGRFERQSGGRGQYGHIIMELTPIPDSMEVEVVNQMSKEDVPKAFHDAVEDSVYDAAMSGHHLGYPLIGLRVTLLGGSTHQSDSTEVAYVAAAKFAFDDCIEKAGLLLLEPIMALEVTVAEGYLRGVLGDLNGRRVKIQDMDSNSDPRIVRGLVPLSEMFGYTTALRSLSQGRAGYTMQPSSYAPVPREVSEKLMF